MLDNYVHCWIFNSSLHVMFQCSSIIRSGKNKNKIFFYTEIIALRVCYTYYKSNLVYADFSPEFLIFQKNNSAQTSVIIFFMSEHYYFFEKLKIVEKSLRKLNCSYGKASHALKKK